MLRGSRLTEIQDQEIQVRRRSQRPGASSIQGPWVAQGGEESPGQVPYADHLRPETVLDEQDVTIRMHWVWTMRWRW